MVTVVVGWNGDTVAGEENDERIMSRVAWLIVVYMHHVMVVDDRCAVEDEDDRCADR